MKTYEELQAENAALMQEINNLRFVIVCAALQAPEKKIVVTNIAPDHRALIQQYIAISKVRTPWRMDIDETAYVEAQITTRHGIDLQLKEVSQLEQRKFTPKDFKIEAATKLDVAVTTAES